ncbi:hypothetical protein N2152v2_008296 [Parachlorella kessleri]
MPSLILVILLTQGTAYELLVRLHTEPGFNKTKKPWWDTLPTPDQVLCTELLSEQDLDVLQSSWLTRHAANMRQLADDFYNGRSGRGKPLNDVIAPASVSFETFLYVSALVTTRTFYFYHDVGGERIAKEYFLPALDMLNHPFEGPGNAWRENDDDWVYERATQPIKEGEQITHAYHVGLTHRPDMSFAVYGFVQKNDPPLLCAQDLPGFTWQRAFDDTPATDTEIDPQGHEAVREEVQRLKEILDGLPTTLEEDEKLLKKASNWKRRTMLELRVERKKALRHRIKHLQQLLDEL